VALLSDRLVYPAISAKVTILLALGVAMFAHSPGKDSMNPKLADEPGFTVIGIEARTSNAQEMTHNGVIGKQWVQFMKENLAAQIPNKADATPLIALYTDYVSDKDGEYTFLLGARVTSAAQVPAGMAARKVPGGRYAVFTSEKGPAEKVVVETWQRIWSIPKGSLGGDRAYKTDYEVYDKRATNPENAQVEVHVGVK
jgi:predicted transcriptional regulator YdeE